MEREPAAGEERLYRFERKTALPMLVLSVVFLPVLVVPMLFDLNLFWAGVFSNLDHFIWFCFLLEYLSRFGLARDRVHFIASNLIDLAVVALPLLRPLRSVSSLRGIRLLQASRVFATGLQVGRLSDRLFTSLSVVALSFVVASFVLTGAALVYEVERYAPNSRIHSAGDALWWAVATVSTVGYGDIYPVTTEGRIIAGCLMFIGICTSGLIAAAFASIFIKDRNEEEFDPKLAALARRLDEIDRLLIRLEETIERHDAL
jgi:voltage-gated potassium channel